MKIGVYAVRGGYNIVIILCIGTYTYLYIESYITLGLMIYYISLSRTKSVRRFVLILNRA